MITVEIHGSKKEGDNVFARMLREEKTIQDINEISNFIINHDYRFNSFKLVEGEVELLQPERFENLEGKFATTNGKDFSIVKQMIYGRELRQLNKETRKWDSNREIAAKFTDGSWARFSDIKILKNINNTNIGFKIILPKEETTKYINEYNLIQHLRDRTAHVTGHRPNKLGGYDMKNPKMMQLKGKLLEVLEDLIVNQKIDRFVNGGALGGDQAFFWCVHILKKKYPHIKNIVAIPFKNQDKKWSDNQKYWYQKMLYLADEVINVELLEDYSTDEHLLEKTDKRYIPLDDFSNAKMHQRNHYMADIGLYTVAIYDGVSVKGGTVECLKYVFKQGKNKVIQINPEKEFEVSLMDRL